MCGADGAGAAGCCQRPRSIIKPPHAPAPQKLSSGGADLLCAPALCDAGRGFRPLKPCPVPEQGQRLSPGEPRGLSGLCRELGLPAALPPHVLRGRLSLHAGSLEGRCAELASPGGDCCNPERRFLRPRGDWEPRKPARTASGRAGERPLCLQAGDKGPLARCRRCQPHPGGRPCSPDAGPWGRGQGACPLSPRGSRRAATSAVITARSGRAPEDAPFYARSQGQPAERWRAARASGGPGLSVPACRVPAGEGRSAWAAGAGPRGERRESLCLAGGDGCRGP
eukprot:XP_005636013.1 uncharacterized protein LOC102155391 [Canis lupus familiaris]